MKKALLVFVTLVCITALTMCKAEETNITEPISNQQQNEVEQASNEQEAFVQSFEYFPIDKQIEKRISGISWREGSPVDIEDLRLVKVTYWGFDDKPHIGEMIVNESVVQDIVEIFQELYAAKFPVDKIKLIDEYNAEDIKSMQDNNTSAFNFREVEGKPGQLSKHSYGIAIDINPVQNPYIYKDKVSPIEGKVFTNRDKISKGMIVKDDVCYKAFISRGWTWGGDWKYEKDYQHFQKSSK